MTTIRATCPQCGEVELTPDDITLRVCTNPSASYYVFVCPLCTDEIRKPADERVVQLLISGGVSATVWSQPGEMSEARYGGPAFTVDDLLDFHLLLQTDDWFDRLLEEASHS